MDKKQRQKLKKAAGIKSEEPYIVPTIAGTMEHLKDESLMLFSSSTHNKKKYRQFYGIGTVYRVVKGDKQDLIYINFGAFPTHKTRLVVAYENHARRQIMTLKRGQVCQVYGLCRYYTTDVEINGVKSKGVRLGLYAKGIQGWYVPTMLDIRKMPINEDLVSPTEQEEKLQETFEDVLDEFLNGTGED